MNDESRDAMIFRKIICSYARRGSSMTSSFFPIHGNQKSLPENLMPKNCRCCVQISCFRYIKETKMSYGYLFQPNRDAILNTVSRKKHFTCKIVRTLVCIGFKLCDGTQFVVCDIYSLYQYIETCILSENFHIFSVGFNSLQKV